MKHHGSTHPSTARSRGRAPGAARRAVARELSSPVCYLHELESATSATGGNLRIKRIYEPADAGDGYRALIDRLWPRGISKQRAALDAWLKELAPSNALRIWYGHDPKRWTEFGRRYRAELLAHGPALDALRARAVAGPVTLLYGSREPRINHAVVLRQILLKSPAARRRPSGP